MCLADAEQTERLYESIRRAKQEEVRGLGSAYAFIEHPCLLCIYKPAGATSVMAS